ncbi:MAG: FolC bifunctional protein, partial [Candidatus Moranbacteria bacterium GW2011_GWE1_36_7]
MKITTLKQFEAFLATRIPTREALFMGTIGLDRAKYFMKLLGNPQNKVRVIHIAGTSGKGSTAHIVSHILQSQGFKVGMSISPHVFDIRERMQVFRSAKASRTRTTNAGHTNVLPSEKMVLQYFNQILPTILKMEKCKYGMPTFFEINVALAFHMFAKEKLDYAVIET